MPKPSPKYAPHQLPDTIVSHAHSPNTVQEIFIDKQYVGDAHGMYAAIF